MRLGYALLSAEFFKAKLREPRRALWPGEREPSMPAFPSLSDGDVDALYAYVSRTRDEPAPLPSQVAVPASAVMLDSSLYDAVARSILQGSCRHCHSAEPGTRAEMRAIFPGPVPTFTIDREGSALRFGSTASSLLSPGSDCSEPPLMQRLRARQEEWAGKPAPVRGMPLTLAPLDPDTIRLVDVWTRRGCPSPQGDLCRKCNSAMTGR